MRIAYLTAGFAVACDAPSPIRDSQQTAQAITGGVEVASSDFPAVVMVRLLDTAQMCTGTLIASDVVLTAGHCFDDYHSSNVEVRVGITNIAVSGGETFQIDHWMVHPSYALSSYAVAHDVALVFLTTPVPSVTPIALNRSPGLAVPGDVGTLVGYGRPSIGGTSGVLRAAYDRPVATCDRVEELIFEVTGGGVASYDEARYVCWERLDGIGKCRGDSGGPTLIDVAGVETIVGVGSQSDVDCEFYSIDAEVAAELEFIDGELAGWQCDSDGVCNQFCEDYGHPADIDCVDQPCQGDGCPTDPGVDPGTDPGDETSGCATAADGLRTGSLWGWLVLLALWALFAGRRPRSRRERAA